MEVAGKGLQGGGKGGGGQRGEGGRVDREVVVVMVAGAGAERGCGRKRAEKVGREGGGGGERRMKDEERVRKMGGRERERKGGRGGGGGREHFKREGESMGEWWGGGHGRVEGLCVDAGPRTLGIRQHLEEGKA
jgi:hypothetical protein